MANTDNIRKGSIIELDGNPYRVIEYSQKVMGRGGSIVKVKLKNLLDGSVAEKRLSASDEIGEADIKMQDVQFLYSTGDSYHFMDGETYEQYEVSSEVVGDDADLLKDGMDLKVVIYNGNVVSVELPIKMEFEVIESPDVVKGDTQSTVLKDAKLEGGLEIKVPMFVNQGDRVVIDTRDRTYVERAKG